MDEEEPVVIDTRARFSRTETVEVPLDPALVEALVPRPLEAGGRLRGSDGTDAVDLRRFETGSRIATDPAEPVR